MSSSRRTALSYGPATTWLRLVLGLLALGLLELAAGHLIVGRLFGAHVAMTIDLVLGVVTIGLLIVLASPLRAAPHVDHDRAELVAGLGLLGGVRIPLATIECVTEYRPPAFEPVGPGAAITGADPVRATFSRGGSSGFVLIRLTEPLLARVMVRRTALVTEVVLQSADPAAAVAFVTQGMNDAPGAP